MEVMQSADSDTHVDRASRRYSASASANCLCMSEAIELKSMHSKELSIKLTYGIPRSFYGNFLGFTTICMIMAIF